MKQRSLNCIRALAGVGVALALVLAGCSGKDKMAQTQARAREFVKAGELEKAKIAYLNVMRKDPGNAEAIEKLGVIWMEQGVPFRAIQYLFKMRELKPKDPVVRTRLATAFLTLKDVPRAQAEAVAALEADPSHGDALMILAESVTKPEDVEVVRRAVDTFPVPDSVECLLARAQLSMMERDVLRAEEAVSRALTANPDSVRALSAMASLRRGFKDMDGAERHFKLAAEKAEPRSPQKLAYAHFLSQSGKPDEARAVLAEMAKKAPDYVPMWMLTADVASGEKKYDEALAALEKVFAIDSENGPARSMQADMLASKQELDKAIGVLNKLALSEPRNPAVKYQLGRTLLLKGDAEAASNALRDAIRLKGNYAEAVFMLAQIDRRSGRMEAAIDGLRSLVEKEPNLTQAVNALAEAYQETGRPAEATALVRRLVEANPKNEEYRLRLAMLLAQTREMGEAKQVIQDVLSRQPDNQAAVMQLVDLELVTGEIAAAEARAQSVLDGAPELALGHLLRGRVCAVQKNWEEAEKSLSKALEIEPKLGPAQDLLIQVRRAAGKMTEAIAGVDAALAASPEDPALLRQAAILYGEKGEAAKAAELYERLLKTQTVADAFILNNLATLYGVYLNQPDRAYELAKKARELRPDAGLATTPQAKLEAAATADTLGWLTYRRGEYASALALCQEAATQLGTNPEVQYHLGLAAAAMGQDETARKSLVVAAEGSTAFPGQDDAKQHLALLGGAAGEPTATSAEVAALLAKSPQDLVLQIRLAEALDREQSWTEAAAAYAAALARNPALPAPSRRLAELYAGPLADPAKALEYARAARQLAPGDARVAAVLGSLVFATGDHLFSYNLLKEATRDDKAQADTWAALSRSAYSQGKIDEARSAAQQALAKLPDGGFAAELQQFLALTDPAGVKDVAVVDAALQKNPRDAAALMARAARLVGTQDVAAAITDYEAVLAVFPAFSPAQKALASLLAGEASTRDRAYELAIQARKALPDDPEVAEVLGRLHFLRNDHRLAVQLLTEAMRSRPPGAESLRCLGLAQAALGDKDGARANLTKAIAAGLAEPEAGEVAKALEALQ